MPKQFGKFRTLSPASRSSLPPKPTAPPSARSLSTSTSASASSRPALSGSAKVHVAMSSPSVKKEGPAAATSTAPATVTSSSSSSAAAAAAATATGSTSHRNGSGSNSNTAVPPSTTSVTTGAKQMKLLAQCDWVDRTLWATRQLLGGNSINGFLRSAATVQRIKRQRARQTASTKRSSVTAAGGSESGAGGTAAAAHVASSHDASAAASHSAASAAAASKGDSKKQPFDQSAEEQLKRDIMNPRTIKKVKTELEAGVHFCVVLQKVLLGIVAEIDPSQVPYFPPLLSGVNNTVEEDAKADGEAKQTAEITSSSLLSKQSIEQHPELTSTPLSVASTPGIRAQIPQSGLIPSMVNFGGAPHPFASGKLPRAGERPAPTMGGGGGGSGAEASSPGNPEGSTLRRQRKKKLPPSSEHRIQVPEVDHIGKRYVTKKEHNFRLCEMYRFRPLKNGDFAAVRTTSRDLWILARVLRDYPGAEMPPLEFLQLSTVRRDALFRDKVLVKDVEDKGDGSATVSIARNLVLPLPRTYSEAAEWGKRYKKDSRVYAMYPQTTALYPATVIDNSTYCRGDDDIIVVEFDGEEPDALTGIVPKYHIPARFVVMIPREFRKEPLTKGGGGGSSGKRKSTSSLPTQDSSTKRSKSQQHRNNTGQISDDALDGMLTEMDYGEGALEDFDQLDLDFNKPLPDGAEPDGIPQSPSKDFMNY